MKTIYIMGGPHVRCVLNPPADRSICSNCVSRGNRSRAVDYITRIIAEKKGRICESRTGRYLVSFEFPAEDCKFFQEGFCVFRNIFCNIENCSIAEMEDE